MVYPGLGPATLATSGGSPAVAEFGLVGLGEIALAADEPPGYTPVSFCISTAMHGDPRRQETTVAYFQFYYWQWQLRCEWYVISDS